ncbi:MAG: hypothetical protein IT365_24500 [Candidatus Hydrogenedentes bacterium]|nr:hypothetical protein [Candidatus Hydrogenedentota bacterium]
MMRTTRAYAIAVFSVVLAAITAHAMSLRDIPLAEITEQTDLWVRGKVVSVKASPLEEDERYRFGHQGTVEVTVVVNVTSSTHPIDAPAVTVHWASSDEFMQRVKKGQECIAALSRRENGTYKTLWAVGIYGWFQVDPESGRVPYVSSIGENVAPNTIWDLVNALDMGQASPDGLDAILVDAWRKRLNEGGLQDFIAAMVFFDAFPGVQLSPAELIAAFERQSLSNASQPRSERHAMRQAVPVLFSLFKRIGDEQSTERLIAIFAQDFSARESAFDDSEIAKGLVQCILAKGGARRVDLVRGLLGKEFTWATGDGRVQARRTPIRADYSAIQAIAEYPGEDTDRMLLDMLHHPATYGIPDSLSMAAVWTGLAKRGNPEVKTYLEAFIANPGTFDLGVRHYDSVDNSIAFAREALQAYAQNLPRDQQTQQLLQSYKQGDLGALNQLFRLVTPGDSALVPVLSSIPVEHLLSEQHSIANAFATTVATDLPDPAFLPQLRALAGSDARDPVRVQLSMVLAAMHACGDTEPARKMAIENLHKPVPSKEWRACYFSITEKAGLVSFLGTLKDPALMSEIDPYTQRDVLDELSQTMKAAALASGEDPHDFAVRNLNKIAILALARAGGGEAIPRLKAIYADDDIAARIAAAMGLYALGDDTGKDIIDLYVNHQELTNTEIAARWRIDLFGDFHSAARYLENPRTDEALLQRLRNGFADGDGDVNAYRKFLKAHESILLPIFVENLSSKDSRLRRDAFDLLRRFHEEKDNYDPDKPPQQQTEAINQIREKVSTYLANPKE